MKKFKFFVVFLALVSLMLSFSVCFAESIDLSSALTPTVADYAGLLSESYENEFTEKLEKLSDKYELDLVFLSTENYRDVDIWNSHSFRDFVCNYYDYLGYGVGSDYSGLIFAIDMKTRSYEFVTTGKAMRIFDTTISTLTNRVEPHLSIESYEIACDTFVSNIGNKLFLGHYLPGFATIIVSLIIGLLVAFIVVITQTRKNKTVAAGVFATAYINESSYKLRNRSDIFVGEHTSRTYIPRSNGGGGGSHRGGGSSGRSHGGGGGHF